VAEVAEQLREERIRAPVVERDVGTSTTRCKGSGVCWRTRMAKKRKKLPKRTPEEEARFEET